MGLSRGVDAYGTIERIDAFCDAVPRRRARAEEHGPLVLFVPTRPGFPYYARPRRGASATVTAEDIRAVRARQRELLIPESFEWIDEASPGMTAAAPAAGPRGPRAPAHGARRAGAAAGHRAGGNRPPGDPG